MPRSLGLILILLAAVAGAIYFFSTQASEVPTTTIEMDPAKAPDAR